MANSLSLRNLRVLVVLLAFLAIGTAGDGSRASEKDGTLVVRVTLDDVDRTPPQDIYIEAHSFNVNYSLLPGKKSVRTRSTL